MSDLNNNPLVSTKDTRARAEIRRYGFAPVLLTGTTYLLAQAIVANDTVSASEVTGLNIGNDVAGSALADFTLCVVDEGDTPSALNAVVSGITVPSGEVLALPTPLFLNPSQTLYAFAGTTSTLRISGWMTAYL